jgi:hypothetical protein
VQETIFHFANHAQPISVKRATFFKWMVSETTIKSDYETRKWDAPTGDLQHHSGGGRKQGRAVKNFQVEQALLKFCRLMETSGVPVLGGLLRVKL